ncbi:hypothetical protein [Chryseobacterium phocaeense]|uniref:hypothetical protein n=1 Tax=Chryseobacterium phocaeense TaxID=1816690 RepID=UPI0009B940BC|nr:hypothetical protein [Chryseobacterium phocaeense]
MKNLVIILCLTLSASYTAYPNETDYKAGTIVSTEKSKPVYTYYRVSRKTAVAPRNAAEADALAGTPATAYLGTSACRSWWLSQPVVPGGVTWSYYYFADGTMTSSSLHLIMACPF